jgi:hypothetical protein
MLCISRLHSLLVVCVVLLGQIAGPTAALAAENAAGEVPTLKETLNYGLKARLPSEFAFIRRVVEEVDNKRLSRKMVLQTFSYARRQSDKIPFPYFQFALRAQAKKLGVTL